MASICTQPCTIAHVAAGRGTLWGQHALATESPVDIDLFYPRERYYLNSMSIRVSIQTPIQSFSVLFVFFGQQFQEQKFRTYVSFTNSYNMKCN